MQEVAGSHMAGCRVVGHKAESRARRLETKKRRTRNITVLNGKEYKI